MSSFSPANQQGPWQPLRNGMPAPTLAIDEGPASQLCFSNAWIPAVFQALKLLVRPESWTGSLTDVRNAVAQAQNLIGSLAPCVPPPNWVPSIHVTDICTDLSQDAVMWPAATCEGEACARVWAGHATQPPVGGSGIYVLAMRFLSCPGGSPVGGEICELNVHQIGSILTNIYTITWTDCLGSPHITTIGGTLALLTHIQAKELCISSLAPFDFTISPLGKFLCGVA